MEMDMDMIEFKRITTRDQQHFSYVERLLIASFPEDEYRDLSVFREYTDSLPHFYCNLLLDDSNPIGLLTYWKIEDFCYIEHFAIAPEWRNGGYGRKVLTQLNSLIKHPIVLEAERSSDDMALRRIRFYQRLGYELWEKEYLQPPYKAGFNELPMYLMVKGDLSEDRDFERIKRTIYRNVYHVEI